MSCLVVWFRGSLLPSFVTATRYKVMRPVGTRALHGLNLMPLPFQGDQKFYSLPYLISIFCMRRLAPMRTQAVTTSSEGMAIQAGVGSATTANGPSESGIGINDC